ncbi:MAG: ribonuclease P protein component [Methylocystaceae bacterium]
MLPKEMRLRKKGEFRQVYDQGKKYFGKYMLLFVIINGSEINRYGIVASKKVGNAVTRNRSRRQVREVIRNAHGKLKSGNDMILVIKSSAVGASLIELQQDFASLCRKAQLC